MKVKGDELARISDGDDFGVVPRAQATPNAAAVRLVRKDGILVFCGDAPPGIDWERLVEEDRGARIRHILDPCAPIDDELSSPSERIS
jgi:hypothetical protein